MTDTATVSWTLTCRFCKDSFLSSEAVKMEKDDFLICPRCNGFSGIEMKRRKPKPTQGAIHDPGQDRLILDLWAWVVVDPRTNLEGVCGIMIDGSPRIAISASIEEAKRMEPFVRAAQQNTTKVFKLVRFAKAKEDDVS